MANEITAKNVRTLAPGGGVANFMGITGNSHRYFWLSTDLIKLMLDRGIRVFEENEDPEVKEVELTLENYNQDTGGATLDEDSDIVVIQDLEGQRQAMYDAEKEEWLAEVGKNIKERQDAISNPDDEEEEEESGDGSPAPIGMGLGMGRPETPTVSEGE